MVRGLITLPSRAARKLKRILKGSPPAIDISDEFTTWLQYANAGMLDRGNLYCFDYAIRNLPSAAPVFEIGSFCGLSTNAIAYYLVKHRAPNTFITCDRWDFENKQAVTVGESSLTHEEYRAFVRETFIRNVRMFSRTQIPNTIELSSDEFFSCWRRGDEVTDVFGTSIRLGGPLSFCYVDGNHSYEYARRDFQNCSEFLDKGGFILFDDSAEGWGFDGVLQVLREVMASGEYELVAKNPNYLFRKL